MIALAAGSMAALFSVSALAAVPHTQMGIPIAPNAGKASEKQWGGVDDAFAVNPDGNVVVAAPSRGQAMMQDQDDRDSDSDDDPDPDHADEVLPI
jgi:hypothetical protein